MKAYASFFRKLRPVRPAHLSPRSGLYLAFLAAAGLASATAAADAGSILVANRTSGTLSVIDEATDQVTKTVSVATRGARPPEPMYVNYCQPLKRVYVSDRANRYVAVYDAKTFQMLDTAPLGLGAFHMWIDTKCKQIWSVNDIDRNLSIINPKTLKLIDADPKTRGVIDPVKLPQELLDQGGKPHDIALDPKGKAAFVTVIGITGKGYVLRYDTKTRRLTHQVEVGIDPHVGVAWKKPVVYVACQGNSKLYALSTKDLSPLHDPVDVAGTHGTGWKHDDSAFYTTNLPGLGKDGLFAIDPETLGIAGKTDTGNASDGVEDVPHNIAITADDKKLYITHSGHGEGEVKGVVTVYDISDKAAPKYLKKIMVGLNPFGITYAPAAKRR